MRKEDSALACKVGFGIILVILIFTFIPPSDAAQFTINTHTVTETSARLDITAPAGYGSQTIDVYLDYIAPNKKIIAGGLNTQGIYVADLQPNEIHAIIVVDNGSISNNRTNWQFRTYGNPYYSYGATAGSVTNISEVQYLYYPQGLPGQMINISGSTNTTLSGSVSSVLSGEVNNTGETSVSVNMPDSMTIDIPDGINLYAPDGMPVTVSGSTSNTIAGALALTGNLGLTGTMENNITGGNFSGSSGAANWSNFTIVVNSTSPTPEAGEDLTVWWLWGALIVAFLLVVLVTRVPLAVVMSVAYDTWLFAAYIPSKLAVLGFEPNVVFLVYFGGVLAVAGSLMAFKVGYQ